MTRKSKIEKPYAGGRWSKARFFSFLRSGLRRMSVRWPSKSDALRASRRPYKGNNKRRKWDYKCAQCGKWFMGKEVRVHHRVEVGTLKCFDDLPQFVERLFCEEPGFVILCDFCHQKLHQRFWNI